MTPDELKLVLEALENAVRYHGIMLMSDPPQDAWKYHKVEDKADKAITAIKEALAQSKQEPVATVEDNSQQWKGMDGAIAFHLIERHADGWNDIRKMMGEWLSANTPQRTWVGLTNNDLQPIAEEYRILFGSWVHDFARAIEAKLKEKNT